MVRGTAKRATGNIFPRLNVSKQKAGRSGPAGLEGLPMDKDRIKGMANQAKGSVKQAAGAVTGDAKLKAEGKAQKTAGKVQSAVGGMKDAVRQK